MLPQLLLAMSCYRRSRTQLAGLQAVSCLERRFHSAWPEPWNISAPRLHFSIMVQIQQSASNFLYDLTYYYYDLINRAACEVVDSGLQYVVDCVWNTTSRRCATTGDFRCAVRGPAGHSLTSRRRARGKTSRASLL